jgi:hypothetical protein
MYDLLCLCSKSETNVSSEPFPLSTKTELEPTRQIEIRGLGSFPTSLQEPTILKSRGQTRILSGTIAQPLV